MHVTKAKLSRRMNASPPLAPSIGFLALSVSLSCQEATALWLHMFFVRVKNKKGDASEGRDSRAFHFSHRSHLARWSVAWRRRLLVCDLAGERKEPLDLEPLSSLLLWTLAATNVKLTQTERSRTRGVIIRLATPLSLARSQGSQGGGGCPAAVTDVLPTV